MLPLFAWLLFASGTGDPQLLVSGVDSLGAPTRDGRYLTHVHEGNLALRDLARGTDRILTTKAAGSKEFAYFSVPSRDGSQVAYAWFNAEGFYELRIVGAGGGVARTIYRNPEAGFVQPTAFTPDGGKILTLLFRKDNTSQIVLISSTGGKVETLRSLQWVYPKRMDLSPDGQLVVYDSFRPGSTTERTIYLLSLDGSAERMLTPEKGSYLFPIFSADGTNITYCGGEGETLDLWQKPRIGGAAKQIATGLGRALPLGITDSGRLFFGLRNGASDIYTFPYPEIGAAKRATLRFAGMNRRPAWSSDGQRLAYLSRRGAENFGQESRTIVIRDWGTNSERELNPRLAYLDGISWSRQGLVVSGSDGKGRGGVFLVDADSGKTRPLVATHGGPFRGYPAVLSSEGMLYFLRDGQLYRKTTGESGEAGVVDLKGKRNALLALALSPDSKLLAVGSAEQGIRILSLPDCAVIAELGMPGSTELSWSTVLLAAKEAKLFEVPLDGSKPRELAMPDNREYGFALSPSGKTLAVTAGEQRQEIWTLQVSPP